MLTRLLLTLACAFYLLQPAVLLAAESRVITAPEVKQMLEDDRVLAIHTLSKIEFQVQHIPKSINIPWEYMASTDKLPADKSRPLIFYCMGAI